ncbi:HNH endonuclease signature motif containing protein [Mycobacterium kansasii]
MARVPDGMDLDHTCWNRRCVNPDHLRVATRKQNCENQQGPSSRSTTGVRGVFMSKTGRITAGVTHNYQYYALGTFTSVEEAEAAVIAKRLELFTHNNADRGETVA